MMTSDSSPKPHAQAEITTGGSFTSRLSSTFWLLMNTPMIPPEEKPDDRGVQMVTFAGQRGSHSRETSRSSMESDATAVSGVSDASSALDRS
ncbi:hypothetical protein C8Q80DRAFT_1139955 [Daedaleopsis nitida]|nr:hypothetical protein C8Q80DRAFT_1139955 [Daedaleopsis nitida]